LEERNRIEAIELSGYDPRKGPPPMEEPEDDGMNAYFDDIQGQDDDDDDQNRQTLFGFSGYQRADEDDEDDEGNYRLDSHTKEDVEETEYQDNTFWGTIFSDESIDHLLNELH
jgi:hypothetical protein